MKQNIWAFGKIFTPAIVARAIKTFDRSLAIFVLTCWGSALFVMLLSIYTVNLSIKAKKEYLEAAAAEPTLPKVVKTAPSPKDIQPLAEQLQKRFPEIKFSVEKGQNLSVTTQDVAAFRLWLTVLSYVDTISPQFRWSLKEFCVGMKCGSGTPMRAVLSAEKISFSLPER